MLMRLRSKAKKLRQMWKSVIKTLKSWKDYLIYLCNFLLLDIIFDYSKFNYWSLNAEN